MSTGVSTASPGVAEQGVGKYVPEPKAVRNGIGLCLSGGGYRATLFHLGGLRRLNELGLLHRVNTISSVSGGSIIAAHVATDMAGQPWMGKSLPTTEWNRRIAEPIQQFTRLNIRTEPILKRFLPWNWFRESTGVEGLAKRYEDDLTRLRLVDLPDGPRFVLCATDMAFGVNWVFEKSRNGGLSGGLHEATG